MKLVYKIFCAILSFAVLPVLFFVPLFRIKISLPLSIDIGLKEYSSIFDMIRASQTQTEQQKEIMKKLLEAITDKNSALGEMFTNRPYFYAFLVFLILTVVVAVVLCVISLVSKKPGAVMGTAAGGILSGLLMNAMFNAFAKPLLNGQIGLKSLLGGGSDSDGLSSLLTGLISNAVSVEHLKLSFAYLLALLLFILVIFVCVCAVMEKTESK